MFTNTSRNNSSSSNGNNNNNNTKSSNSSKQNIKSSLSYFSKFSKRSRRINEPNEGGQFSKDISNDSNESNQLNTSSASSSGYMSGFKPIHSTTNRPYTSQQHFYHFGGGSGANNCNDKTGTANTQLTADNSNGIDFDDTRDDSSRRLPNLHLNHHRQPHQAKQFIGHHQQQQQQQQHPHQTRYQLPQSNLGLLKGGHNEASAMRTPMMVPMMIEDNNIIDGTDEGNVVRHESDDNESETIGAAVIGADGGELEVDGVDLIDDDIDENLNGQLDNNNAGNNYNGSTCYDANRLRSIYAARLNRSRDCALDTSMSVVDHRNNHHQYQERYFQPQQQQHHQQQQQQQQLQYFIQQTPNRSQNLPQKQYFNGQTNSFAPPLHSCSTSTYNKYHENENEDLDLSLQHTNTYHQPISAIYHQPNIPNYQLQQQYHSFSYLQPQSHQQYHQLQQQYPSSLIQRTLNASNNRLASSSIQLIPNTSSSHLESSSAGESSHSSSTGAPNNSRVALQPTKSRKSSNKTNSKMQNSRQQHLTSDTSQQQQQQQQQHHHHHQQQQQLQQNPKRNLQTIGSRKKTHHNAISSNNTMADNHKVEKLGLGCCAKMAKLLLFITNVTFWSAGIALGAWGILSLVEDHKYNLSQLLVFESNTRMSLFQLLAWSFITLGCATILVGFCGCSAILKNNRWILGLYIFLILAIFALDLATGLLAIIFQEKLVANVRLRLTNKLRSEYGVQASFTAAIDYIQTKYECCGLEGHFDYDQSLWRLQRLGGFEATVARTCCHLRNNFDDHAHINPRPVNESMCQSTDVRFHQSYRYRKGCLDDLEKLIRQKIWTFTIGCIAVGGAILLSLIFATCFCRSIPSSKLRKSSRENQITNHLDGKKQQGVATTTALMYQQQLQQQQQQQQSEAQQKQLRHYR